MLRHGRRRREVGTPGRLVVAVRAQVGHHQVEAVQAAPHLGPMKAVGSWGFQGDPPLLSDKHCELRVGFTLHARRGAAKHPRADSNPPPSPQGGG